jgi:tetratricopeptide (TPR) repeat protein
VEPQSDISEACRLYAHTDAVSAASSETDMADAIARLRRAAALLTPPSSTAIDETDAPTAFLTDEILHGRVCQRLGELLWASNCIPEAIQAFQEASDAFGRGGAELASQECARKVIEGVTALRQNPQDRLYLLIAQIERERRQLALTPESEAAQAECLFRIATILQRRDRFTAAAERYRGSLSLFERAPEAGLKHAECHHRLADLYNHELDDEALATAHYRAAASLYARFEPDSEGEQMSKTLCEWQLSALAASGGGHR